MNIKTVSVIIPTWKPDRRLLTILNRLGRQTLPPEEILIINTQEELFPFAADELPGNVTVHHISKAEFDHGGTRDMAARMARGELLIFMTMDAVPADTRLLEKLAQTFEDDNVAAAYARQLPRKNADVLEKMTRSFNYGPESRKKTAADLPVLGIKTYFCSNACAAYRREIYLREGGFAHHVIFNEDMIFAHRLITDGYAVCYCAQARVYHSHHYSAGEQFRRNFDLGVSQTDHPEVFSGVSSESEGIRMVASVARDLLREGKVRSVPVLAAQSGAKFLGYRLGRAYRHLPQLLINRWTMNREYWKRSGA